MSRDGYLTVEGLVMLAMGLVVGVYALVCILRGRRSS